MFVNRYLRYTPSVLFLLLFMLSFIPYALVNGPSIRFLDNNVQMCRDHWWSTILMVQNYVNVNKIVRNLRCFHACPWIKVVSLF
jgi:hypothetical protein